MANAAAADCLALITVLELLRSQKQQLCDPLFPGHLRTQHYSYLVGDMGAILQCWLKRLPLKMNLHVWSVQTWHLHKTIP